jgi:hypothetical protein
MNEDVLAVGDKTARTTEGRGTLDRRDLALIVMGVLLAAGVRLVFSGGIFSPDEMNYLRDAALWWTGRFELKNALFLHDTRPLMFVPVAWSFAGLGVSEAAALLWPFLASLAVVVLVYLTARRLFGRETASYSILCAVFFPLLVQEATRLLPGVVMNLLIAVCALCFVISEQAEKQRWMWLTASGMAYAAIQAAGELGVVLVCFFLAAVISWRRYSLWTYWPAVAGFAAVAGLSAVYFWVETGDPLFKLGLSKTVMAQVKAVSPHQPLYYTKVILAPLSGNGGVFYLAGIGCVAGLLAKRREALFVSLWIAVTWALLEFGSVSLSEYRQLSKEVRYFSVVSVPFVILAGYGVARIRHIVGRRRSGGDRAVSSGAVVAVFILVAIVSVWTLKTQRNGMGEQRANLRTMREDVRRYEGKPIYVTHWFWNTAVGYFMRFEEEYFPSGYDPYHAVHLESADSTSMNRYVQTLEPGESMAPGLLLHDERLFQVSQGEREAWSVGVGEIPGVLAHIPPEWRLVKRLAFDRKYLVALYEIPEGATWPAGGQR